MRRHGSRVCPLFIQLAQTSTLITPIRITDVTRRKMSSPKKSPSLHPTPPKCWLRNEPLLFIVNLAKVLAFRYVVAQFLRGKLNFNKCVTLSLTRCQTRRTVLFAEPGVSGCGLLPGDRLLGIEDHDVEHATQEQAVQKIKSAGESVRLVVQPIPELTELSVRSPDGQETYLLSDQNIRELSFKQSLINKGKMVSVM